jgi:cation:H+ antiporter
MVAALVAFVYFSYRQSRREETAKEKEEQARLESAGHHEETIEHLESIVETISAVPDGVEDERSAVAQREASPAVAKSVLLIAAGLVLLYFGASFTVDNAVAIATEVGISERVVGLTIVAVGTSLPELVTSVVAARKKHADLSVGNIVGSSIFNVLAIVGISAAIAGVSVNPAMFTDYAVMIAFSLVLIPIMRSRFVISRVEGIGLVVAYFAYLVLLLMM